MIAFSVGSKSLLALRARYQPIARLYDTHVSLSFLLFGACGRQPLWTSAAGTKLDSKLVTATVKKSVDQAKALADSPSTSPDKHDVCALLPI
jgi:hypothetical protein